MARSAFISTPSTTQIMTTAECKTHLRVDYTDDDTYIASLAMAAQQAFEEYCNIILMSTEVKQVSQFWDDTFELFKSPVQNSGQATINWIKYYDINNVFQTWDAANYNTNIYSCPLQIMPNENIDYPSIYSRLDAIEVKYTIGYETTGEVPHLIKQCLLILVGQWYENRQEAVVDPGIGTIPMTARYIMDKYKIRSFGLPSNS